MKLYYENNNLLSEKQFNNHLQLYEGYIDKVNDINKKTKEQQIENITAARTALQYALNGVILHELYFENIKNEKISPTDELDSIVLFKNNEEFLEWRTDFINIALNTRGWVIYTYEPRSNQFINLSLKSHDEGLICHMIPIIVLDMYEHAYYTDYDNNKKEYINQFINNIDWNVIRRRIK